MTENYGKMKVALRYWLIGQGYFKAVEAMNLAEKYHNGKRKDGAHEFSHQVSQAHLARTLIHHLRYKEETFIVIFLHDICEDKDISFEEIDLLYGLIVGKAVRLITKVYRGIKKETTIYYDEMAKCPLVSVDKTIDRIHNLMTMIGGFSSEKRIAYIKETLTFTVPMLRAARSNFPDQEGAYENLKFIITNQVQLYKALDGDNH